MNINLVEFDKNILEFSWIWLNDPEIKFLTDTPEFTKEQQWEWFNSLPNRKDYFIWGVKVDSTPIGACGLKNCTLADGEYWGYIGEKEYWGKGIGKKMLFLIEQKASEMGKSSIWLKVIKENERAFILYKKQGYYIEFETNLIYILRKQL